MFLDFAASVLTDDSTFLGRINPHLDSATFNFQHCHYDICANNDGLMIFSGEKQQNESFHDLDESFEQLHQEYERIQRLQEVFLSVRPMEIAPSLDAISNSGVTRRIKM